MAFSLLAPARGMRAFVRLSIIIAGNTQLLLDVERSAFQQATPGANHPDLYLRCCISQLSGFKEHAAQQPCVKRVLGLAFFPPSCRLLLSAKGVFPAFSMARSVAKLVAVVLILQLFCIGVCVCEFGSGPGFRKHGF